MKILIILTILLLLNAMGADDISLQTTAIDKAVKILNVIFLAAKVIGALAIVSGIWDLFLSLDAQQRKNDLFNQGGAILKIIGGVCLMLSIKFILWMMNFVKT